MRFLPAALACICVCLQACRASSAGGPPLRGRTPAEPGLSGESPYAVGFRSGWILDRGRRYRTESDVGADWGAGKEPRPILILAWYPAKTSSNAREAMPHSAYFDIDEGEARVHAFATALARYARGISVSEICGKDEAELSEEEGADLAAVLSSPSACIRDAEPLEGAYPLVVYHSGAGSSYEDNAGLCEQLASRGYVVVGSAYPAADGASLGIDGGRGSAEDMQCLVRWACEALPVDWRRIALVGHSAGAQAIFEYTAQAGCVADALVLLDTTQDYYALAMPMYERLVREVTAGIARFAQPMLVAAGPEAQFALCDTLVEAPRVYLTLPGLGHDEYISQGLQRLRWLELRGASRLSEVEASELERAELVRATHDSLNERVLAFLDARLSGREEAFERLLQSDRTEPWSCERPCLLEVPAGTSAPEPYDPTAALPPTPRQFVRLLLEQGASAACAELERFRAIQPRHPLYTSTMLAGSLLYTLATTGRVEEARTYYASLLSYSLPALSLFEFLAHMAELQGQPQRARALLEVAAAIDPTAESITLRLRSLSPEAAGR